MQLNSVSIFSGKEQVQNIKTRNIMATVLTIILIVLLVVDVRIVIERIQNLMNQQNINGFSAVKFPKVISSNLKIIGKGSFPRWSATTNLITFTDQVDEQYEIFTMKPDGTDRKCLTCNKPGLKNAGNRGQSSWSPDGKYIIFHAENKNLARIPLEAAARPGWGRNYNIWIMSADGSKFWQMTDYKENWAVFEAYFSNNGKMVVWGEEYSMEKYPNGKKGDKLMPWSKPTGEPWGHPGAYHTAEQFFYRRGEEMLAWRTVYADISFTSEGPKITNLRRINPPVGFTLNEVNGFTPDDKGFIGCWSNLKETNGLARWGEIYTFDLEGRLTKRLTNTIFRHDEDAVYSPDGTKIVYKETSGMPGQGDEIYIMNADGSSKKKLTHFTEKGYPEYDQQAEEDTKGGWRSSGTRITELAFSPDSKQIVFGRMNAKSKSKESHGLLSYIYILSIE